MTERERAHPPSLPTSPTEKSPPSDSSLSPNGDIPDKNEINKIKLPEGLDPEGQETVTDSSNEVQENTVKEDSDISGKVYILLIFI